MSETLSSLESTYRRALLAYPGSWRKRNGEEMVGVLMDAADQERRTVATTSELFNLVGAGLTTRCERLLGNMPVTARDKVSCMALTVTAAFAAIMLVLGELGRWFRFNSFAPSPGLFGLFTTPAALTYVLVMAAFGAAVLGLGGLRRILLGLSILTAMATPMVSSALGGVVHVGWPVLGVFIGGSILGLIGDPTHTPTLRRVLMIGAPLGALVLGLTSFLQGGGAQKSFYPGGVVMCAEILSIAGGSLLVAGLLAWGIEGRLRPVAVLLALALLPLPIKALFVLYIPNPLWGAIAGACLTAGIFVAWQVRQSQVFERKGQR
ncbi:hypothetical protein [Paenarthrobacter sp. FR1]|uniref:hypothetical protein n=1 Tax=Paenarthrobacter sp. FR1 TaxID=3439548 RepID=UPI003DA43BC2